MTRSKEERVRQSERSDEPQTRQGTTRIYGETRYSPRGESSREYPRRPSEDSRWRRRSIWDRPDSEGHQSSACENSPRSTEGYERRYSSSQTEPGDELIYEQGEGYHGSDRRLYQRYDRGPYSQTYPAGFAGPASLEDPYPGHYNEVRTWGQSNVLKCRDIMTRNVTTCAPSTMIREIADKMEGDDIGSIPIVDSGKLVGLITDRDIVCRVMADDMDTRSSIAANAMSQDIVTCLPDEPVVEAVRKMAEFMIRRLPVVDYAGRLRGIVSIADVALEAELDAELARAIEEISRPLPLRSRRFAGGF